MISLARKYRPRTFAEVAVQTHVSNTLRGAIARGRVAHGYLLCGPRGVGKTTLARVLAMALNCENRQPGAFAPDVAAGVSPNSQSDLLLRVPPEAGEPCGECLSCRRIWSGSSSLDVVEIDAASNRGVDDARELRERAMYAPSGEQRWKVYIIDEAHMLTREAWNALLKILEEPPPRVVFVFATTEPHRIAQFAAPVLSRLQRFDLRRIGTSEIRTRLDWVLGKEGVAFEVDALGMIARAADGSMRDALSLTDQVLALGGTTLTAESVREALGLVAEDEFIAVLDLIAARKAGDVFAAVSRLVQMGVDLGLFLSGLGEILRAQLAVTLGGDPGEVSERARQALLERTGRLASADLLRMLSALAELEPRFRRSAQQQLLLETMLVRFALIDRTVAIEDVLREFSETPASPGGSSAGSSRETAPHSREVSGGRGGLQAVPPRGDSGVPRVSDVAPSGRSEWRAGAAAGIAAVAEPGLDPGIAPSVERSVATGRPSVHVADINAVAGAWDDIVAAVRRERPFVASLLEQAIPTAATVTGLLTLTLESESVREGLAAKKNDVLAALRSRIGGLQRVDLRSDEAGAPKAGVRMTAASARSDTLASLRRRSPLMAAAIDALDLELVD